MENSESRNREDKSPLTRIVLPFQEFLHKEATGGILLIAAAVIALIWANSSWADAYKDFFHMRISIGAGSFALSKTLTHWINDGLMALFFFVIGLEIKREVLAGELSSLRLAALPAAAAAGGMVVPALLYVMLNRTAPGIEGWGIPMATDIAFAIGIMSILGKRVPLSLKVFLTAVAIVDDIGAVLVIAVFYTEQISAAGLAAGVIILAALFAANKAGIRNTMVYMVLGIILWFAFLKSGVHATIAGVLLAMTIPARPEFSAAEFSRRIKKYLENIIEPDHSGRDMRFNEKNRAAIGAVESTCRRAETPLERLEHILHPWVSLVIMPVFALANAGVAIGNGFAGSLGIR